MKIQLKIKKYLYNMESNKDNYEWSFLIRDCTSIPLHNNTKPFSEGRSDWTKELF